MTRDADNRTTELLKDYVIALRRLEYDVDKPGSRMTIGEFEAKVERVTDEYAQAIAATLGEQRSTVEIAELLDEFEHECYMLRVEASETRARDDVVRESYERIRDEFAGRIAATVGQGTCIPHGEWERLSQTQEFRRMYCDCGYELGTDSRDSFPFARTAYAAMPRFCPECGARIVSKGKAVKR